MPKSGLISASMGKRLMTKGRGKDNEYGATFDSVVLEVVAGLFGYDITTDISHIEAVQRGIEHEWMAIEAYQSERLVKVEYTGDDQNFIASKEYPWLGATPDGFVGQNGLIEVKNPNPRNHFANLLDNEQMSDYYAQFQIQMLATGRTWVDWVSYDDDCPVEQFKLHIVRITRDESFIEELIERSKEAMKRAIEKAKWLSEEKNVPLIIPEWSNKL